jgi:hypothetical protein
MSLPLALIVLLLLAVITIQTISYAAWNWKHNNKPGAIVVVFISLLTIALPVYVYFFRT